MGKLTCYFVMFALLHSTAYAGEATDSTRTKIRIDCPQHTGAVIKTNLLPVFWGSIPFTSEFRYVQEVPVGLFQSSQVGVSYIGKSIFLTIAENGSRQGQEPRIKVSGFRLQYSHRFYFSPNKYAPAGPYIGPLVSYTTAKFSTRFAKQYDHYVQASHFNITLVGGYQAMNTNGFVIDVFLGIGYKKNTWEEHSAKGSVPIDISDIPFYSSPVKVVGGFNMGMAF